MEVTTRVYDEKGWEVDGNGWIALECDECKTLNDLDRTYCSICGEYLNP